MSGHEFFAFAVGVGIASTAWMLFDFVIEWFGTRKRKVSQKEYFHFCKGCTIGTELGRKGT